MDKTITGEEYEKLIIEKEKVRKMILNTRFEIATTLDQEKKLELIKSEKDITKRMKKIIFDMAMYEITNNIERKKTNGRRSK